MTRHNPTVEERERYEDRYEPYERLYDPLWADRPTRRRRQPQHKHIPKRSEDEILAALAEPIGLEGGFRTTYQPGLHEEAWLLSSLHFFYEEELITDILASIRGGKEANVYRCAAHPTIGEAFLAAKVYRPRMFRTIRNDATYRRGRQILAADGRPVKKTDHRVMRAIGKKTAFGVQVMHTSWLMHEYMAMKRLHEAGGAVPRPVAFDENAILMSYHGDAHVAAPTLNQVRLQPNEAEPLFQEVLRNVRLMLEQEMIHGDLSAYNILYWQGAITIIDFPQVVSSATNDEAYQILWRDIERICSYFQHQGVACQAGDIADELWHTYVEVEGGSRLADLSRLEAVSDALFDKR